MLRPEALVGCVFLEKTLSFDRGYRRGGDRQVSAWSAQNQVQSAAGQVDKLKHGSGTSSIKI